MDVHNKIRRQRVYGLVQSVVALVSAWLVVGPTSWGQTTADTFRVEAANDEIKLMTYNVLNLFDNVHDTDKKDWTWLPISDPLKKECARISNPSYREDCETVDWTPDKIKLKLSQIKTAISFQGSLPDVLALQEIEGPNITGMLAKELGYQHFLITNSPDERGINVAILYNTDKLEFIEHEEIDATGALKYPGRNILRVHFRPRGGRVLDVIGVYVNHWPAQMVSPIKRVETARVLAKAIDAQTTAVGKDNYKVIVLGDFNMTETEQPNAFHHVLTNPYWQNYLIDVQDYSEVRRSPYRHRMPPGSYFMGGIDTWRRFDRFAVSKNLTDESGMHVVYDSFRIVGPNELTRPRKMADHSPDFYATAIQVPYRGNPHTTNVKDAGFSDHLPIVMKVKFNGNPDYKKPK